MTVIMEQHYLKPVNPRFRQSDQEHQQVKLVITGMVDWGLADPYYAWINSFKEAAAQGLVSNGTEITPAPYMEVKAANGNWVRVPQDRQIPLPSDYNARTFTVDLTGIFPARRN